VTATVSPWAELLSKLQQLQQRSPGAFKRVAGDMAATVESQTQKATGGAASSVTKLGDQLKQAAKTGELPVFKPTHHSRHARTQATGSAPSLLQTLLAQVDHVLGPGATPT
jgi:hypothetical protein